MWPDRARSPGRWAGCPASTASVVVLAQPVVAAVAGWILFHESAHRRCRWLGGALTLVGVVIAQRAPVYRPQ
jgi:drug/metabolite transporter (DMT)-like permease